MEALGRTAKVQLFRNRNEVAQVPPNKILDVLNEWGQTAFRGDKNA
jgi:hypothetical protein